SASLAVTARLAAASCSCSSSVSFFSAGEGDEPSRAAAPGMLDGRGTILALGRGGRTGAAELKRPDVTADGGEITGGAESEGGGGAGVTGGGALAPTGAEGGAAAVTETT